MVDMVPTVLLGFVYSLAHPYAPLSISEPLRWKGSTSSLADGGGCCSAQTSGQSDFQVWCPRVELLELVFAAGCAVIGLGLSQ